jgi:hypothetical protein
VGRLWKQRKKKSKTEKKEKRRARGRGRMAGAEKREWEGAPLTSLSTHREKERALTKIFSC